MTRRQDNPAACLADKRCRVDDAFFIHHRGLVDG